MLRSIAVAISLLATSGAFAGPMTVLIPATDHEQSLIDDGVAHESDRGLRPEEIREGLFISGAPSVIQNAWHATVGLFIPIKTKTKFGAFGYGSGSIVKVEPSGPSQSKLFILTAYHVAIAGVKAVGASSPNGFEVVTNVYLDRDSKVLKGGADFKILSHGIKIEKASKDDDLVLASIEVKNDDLDSITSIQLSDCNIARRSTVYGLGFPDASERQNPSPKLVPFPGITTKRWSTGVYLGKPYYDPSVKRQYVESTQDLASGDSGGPTVDDHGRLIGVQLRGWPETYIGYNLNARCSSVMDFLRSAGISNETTTNEL